MLKTLSILAIIAILAVVIAWTFVSDISQLEETKPINNNQQSLLSKLQSTDSYKKERSVILEFVDSYRYSDDSKYTLGEAMVVFFHKSHTQNPELIISESIFNPMDQDGRIKNEHYWNNYNVYFTLGNFHGKTIDVRFSINPTTEKITHVYDEGEVAGWLLQGLHYDLERDNAPDIPLEMFLSQYYNNKFVDVSESDIVSKLESERFDYFDDRKNPESWWTGRSMSGADTSYEIKITDSVYRYDGSIFDSNWNPDGSWTWKIKKPDTAEVFNSDGTIQINDDGTAKFKDVIATAEAVLEPDGSGNFTLTYSYSHSYLADKTEGFFNSDRSWVVKTHMKDGNVLEAVGSSESEWTGILISNTNLEKRFINSNGILTVITLDLSDHMQKTCVITNDLWDCKEEKTLSKTTDDNFCIKSISIYQPKIHPLC